MCPPIAAALTRVVRAGRASLGRERDLADPQPPAAAGRPYQKVVRCRFDRLRQSPPFRPRRRRKALRLACSRRRTWAGRRCSPSRGRHRRGHRCLDGPARPAAGTLALQLTSCSPRSACWHCGAKQSPRRPDAARIRSATRFRLRTERIVRSVTGLGGEALAGLTADVGQLLSAAPVTDKKLLELSMTWSGLPTGEARMA
jgi:hypothetical protein